MPCLPMAQTPPMPFSSSSLRLEKLQFLDLSLNTFQFLRWPKNIQFPHLKTLVCNQCYISHINTLEFLSFLKPIENCFLVKTISFANPFIFGMANMNGMAEITETKKKKNACWDKTTVSRLKTLTCSVDSFRKTYPLFTQSLVHLYLLSTRFSYPATPIHIKFGWFQSLKTLSITLIYLRPEDLESISFAFQLEKLVLGSNQLDCFPNSLLKLSNLKHFSFTNQICRSGTFCLPEFIYIESNVDSIDDDESLTYKSTQSTPHEIHHSSPFPKLYHLNLSNSFIQLQISNNPSFHCQLSVLILSKSKLNREFSQYTFCKMFYASFLNCHLTTLPKFSFSYLHFLDIRGNPLSNPKDIQETYKHLKYLYL